MALQGQHWSPSHVQVTVLRARGLRAKGKHGTSDAFAIIQLGKEKYCTSVLEKTLEPQWREECSFEVMPGWVEEPQQHGRELFLAVMHRSLMGLDKFLGQLSLPLVTLFQDKNSRKSAWYKLCSKPGQPEKPRGEIQISVQFVRNNLTASMFDLSSREKQRSALGKLKDKMKGRKKHDGLMAESASAIVPSSVGQIYSDEEFGERETPEKKPKKGFFSKPRLHKSSLTKSNTSLCSQHSMKSMESIGSSTGALTVSPPQTPKTPTGFPPLLINKTNGSPSLPKILTHKRALSDEVGQTNVSDAKGLAPMSSPLSRSSLCINGSHVYSEETPASGLFPAPSSLSRSLLDVDHQAEEPPRPAASQEPGGRRGSEKADSRLLPPVITVGDGGGALDPARDGQGKEGAIGSARGAKPVHAAAPIISTVEPTKKSIADETKKASIFPFGSDGKDSESKRSRTPSPVRKSSSLAERGRTSGWFLKDSNHKPSPHPVKPISTAMPEVTEKKSGRLGIGSTLSSGLEKLKNATTGGIIPVRSPAPAHEEQEAVKESKPGDPVARYYHLTHDELIQKILQQELELQKKSNHVRDLEDYIDLLLVQIIEQKPSILQSVSQTVKNKAAHK
uniref:rab11 family-interacting protein 5-like isoform X2 n=1 Tax=Pristiophorus japonicus TaxID=55135 RepID=UPI00398F500A